MGFLKDNVTWIAPTAAILLVGAALVDRERGLGFLTSGGGAEAPVAEPTPVDQVNAAVLASLAPLAEQTQSPEAVTRNAPVDLLTPAAQVAPQPEAPLQAALSVPAAPAPTPQVDQGAAADFFNSAQTNLAVANACADNLRALAAQARVYFPSGAAAGDEAGLNAARLVGLVARDCPGFTVQVEGHSDASGDPVTNQRLSEARAQAVVSRLDASGIDTSNFVVVGFGDTRPSGVTGPEERGFYDRRVEFSIVQGAQQARFSPGNLQPQPWQTPLPACAEALDRRASAMRQFYAPGAITVPANDMDAVYALAADIAACDGARLRLVGQHENAPGTREGPGTGRLRALAMMSVLVSAGYPSDQILIGAPSQSINVPGQPALPNSRIDFQVIAD